MTIEEINSKFQELMKRIVEVTTNVEQLDALRIQQVYTYTPPNPEDRVPNEQGLIEITDITAFISECWSKLSVYHGVYCNLGATYYFKFKGEDINNGDFLIKQPNNTFLHIPGNTPFYYQPQSYDPSTGQLTFQLVNSGTAAATVTVPTWSAGNSNGHIFAWESNVASASIYYGPITIPTAHIKGGRYFINNEEIIFPPSAITVDASTFAITLPTAVTSCYIPYLGE